MQPFTVIIPARYASSRLPGKPLANIHGKPMVQWVYQQAQKSKADRVVVATDNEQIKSAVEGFGGQCILTREDHASGTDRLQESAALLGLGDEDIVVNVQGDEPLIPPQVIDQVAHNLASANGFSAATLSEKIHSFEEFVNPNAVKVVADPSGRALYFSRAPVPWPRDHFNKDNTSLPEPFNAQRHIGIYAYKVALLNQFVTWQMAELEQVECLEQLRILANGKQIHVAQAMAAVPGGVDTAEDLAAVRKLIEQQE
ncbi:3-deoxy-manno-octulosonate cytidylyltransferase [Halioxenophilus aromaticivorans]|uniref:3-deoxy-manno-octulosonate cytidylyltransferase n=1 Tax=Halioxenophilus aromaticivorans TaxID=1306992 RepID=A0AAV3TWV1_9ALTE